MRGTKCLFLCKNLSQTLHYAYYIPENIAAFVTGLLVSLKEFNVSLKKIYMQKYMQCVIIVKAQR